MHEYHDNATKIEGLALVVSPKGGGVIPACGHWGKALVFCTCQLEGST
jgi:hypothetical protein